MKTAAIYPRQDGVLVFESPYDPGLVGALKAAIPYTERRWDREGKVWLVSGKYGQTLADLTAQYLGQDITVPKVKTSAKESTELIKLMYLGTAKDRGNGQITAYGWVNGGWTVIFPLGTLHEWFNVDQRPDEAPTLYAVLGVPRTVTSTDLKSAYRRAARQWHPDVCNDPDATAQFQQIQRAYEVLKDNGTRRKYDAGLALAATVDQGQVQTTSSWRPPLRCGYLLVTGKESLGRFVVSKVLQWEDIQDNAGRVLVTYWVFGDDRHSERWI